MNIRIKDLIKQATVLTDNPDERVQRLQLNNELLVKLVVEECARQCNPQPGLKYSPNSLSSRLDCKQQILSLLD